MSNFIQLSFDPVVGAIRCATWIDDYFGPHQYGVQFDSGGPVYRPDQVEVADAGEWIADLRAKLVAAEAEIGRLRGLLDYATDTDAYRTLRRKNDALASKLVAAEAREARMREALEIIAGKRQCIDNLMSNVDVAEWTLKHTQPSDYREARREEEVSTNLQRIAGEFAAGAFGELVPPERLPEYANVVCELLQMAVNEEAAALRVKLATAEAENRELRAELERREAGSVRDAERRRRCWRRWKSRERVRREERERIAKVADECVLIDAETIRALGDSNANDLPK